VCPRARAFNGRRLLIYVNHARFPIPSVPFIPKRPLTVRRIIYFDGKRARPSHLSVSNNSSGS